MEITKMLNVSTAHISEITAELLDKSKSYELHNVVYNKKEYGWFIYLDKDNLDNYYEPYNKEDYFYVPEELLKLMKFAKDVGCDWLCLDRDGEVLDYFETFNW